jgi:hypothetical protein
MQHGYQCGMIWGAALAAGAQAYRLHSPGPQAETGAIIAAQRLVESFHARNKDINCLEITGLDKSSSSMQMMTYFLIKGGAIRCFRMAAMMTYFLIKGGAIRCFRMAAGYAPVAFSEINAALSEKHIEAPSPPVSCAAMLAQKMGASDMHAVMAAGLAGGIGLSGGACGALGAAIWITGMNRPEEPVGFNVMNSWAGDMIDRFLKCTDYEFECSEIVGRRFENVGDHAGYLRDGGCSKIIEVLGRVDS